MKSAATFLLLSLILTTDAQYSCPASCTPPACVCGSKSIPGGLTPDQTPQFVTLTWDDSVQIRQFAIFDKLLSLQNPNGCPIPSTFFVSFDYNEMDTTQRLYNQYQWEIATHTINHLNSVTLSAAALANEIEGERDALNIYAGIPRNAITGFRHPFLSYNKATYDTLFGISGMVYESSVTLDPIINGWWPHTLDYGMPYNPQNCINCPPGTEFIYPGKWSIPIYTLLKTDNTLYETMDPSIGGSVTYEIALSYLKHSFTTHRLNKLPFGLYQHPSQYIINSVTDQEARQKLMVDFVKWTLTFPDVWYVTNQQLIKWIQSPIPLTRMNDFIPCVLAAQNPSNAEMCDGVDNKGDGQFDIGLKNTCPVMIGAVQSTFASCFGCPASKPSGVPLPARSGSRVIIPENGCSDNRVWDPVSGTCVVLIRPVATIRAVPAGEFGENENNPGTKNASLSLKVGSFILLAYFMITLSLLLL